MSARTLVRTVGALTVFFASTAEGQYRLDGFVPAAALPDSAGEPVAAAFPVAIPTTRYASPTSGPRQIHPQERGDNALIGAALIAATAGVLTFFILRDDGQNHRRCDYVDRCDEYGWSVRAAPIRGLRIPMP